MTPTASFSGKLADFKGCPCFEVLLLSGGDPRATWVKQERRAKAQVARMLGWAAPDSSDEQALAALRGRGARAAGLKRVVKRTIEPWDRRDALKKAVAACLTWIDHLRAENVRDLASFHRHLRSMRLVRLDAPDVFDAPLRSVQPELNARTYRASQALGRRALAALWGASGEEAVKKRALPKRRQQGLHVIKIDLNELGELASRHQSTNSVTPGQPPSANCYPVKRDSNRQYIPASPSASSRSASSRKRK